MNAGTKAAWLLSGSLVAGVVSTSACELVVGDGNYSSGSSNGGSSTSGGSGSNGGTGSGASSSGSGSGSGASSSGSGGGSSAASGSGGSSSGSGGGSSAASGSGGSGASSGATSDTATPFVTSLEGATLTFTEDFAGCGDSSYDGDTSPATDSLMVTASPPSSITVVTTTTATGMSCTFTLSTTQTSSEYVATGTNQTCVIADASSGLTTTSNFPMVHIFLPKTLSPSDPATFAGMCDAVITVTRTGAAVTSCPSSIVEGTVP